MTTIHIGCKKHLMSSKEGGAYLIFADVGTTKKTYKAFDVIVPDECKAGEEEVNTTCPCTLRTLLTREWLDSFEEEINATCPYCGSNVKLQFNRKTRKIMRRIPKIICSITGLGIPLIILFYSLLVEDILIAFGIFLFFFVLMSIPSVIAYYLSIKITIPILGPLTEPLHTNDPNHFLKWA